MSDLAAWLENLGLGKYQEVFAENDIDFQVLPKLTEEHFKELGLSLGHRVKLLEAIESLRNSNPSTPQPPTPNATTSSSQAERRQLTVMFVDLVGSTALSERLDPEDLSEIMRRYQDCCTGIISRFSGYIAKFMGDGILVYFGYPQAHEDDAERAVRTGLDIVQAVSELGTVGETKLQVRIGIATGLVVVGEIIGRESAQEHTVVGETPNLAARLQTLAKPSQILLAESSRQLLGSVFELADLGAQNIKGLSRPVKTYAVQGISAQESRFAAHRADTLGEMVGRDQELGLLLEHWLQAKAGEGQLVLLSGEAGIGKSRILRAFGDSLEDQPHHRIYYQCSPYHSDSTLYPVIQQITRAARFITEDDTETKLDKLEKLLGQTVTNYEAQTLLIAELLGLDGDNRYGKLNLTPQQRRTQTLRILVDYLAALARQQPVLCVVEDAHWIDPTTLELIDLSLNAISQSQILLLITARPSFEHRFGDHPIVTRLPLNRLRRDSSRGIIERLGGGKTLPDELIDEIIRKTDGVPLFVEEFTKTALESEWLRETDDAFFLDDSLDSIDIPNSLHDSLMARLDRVQLVREVAQIAACIGREFSYDLLAAVAQLNDEHLQAALDQLLEAELIFRRGTQPEAYYTFKHALVRDVAYESLLKTTRQQIHVRLLAVLENKSESAADILAPHASAAGIFDKAIDYWQQAGQQANDRSAYREALAFIGKGQALLAKQHSAVSEHTVRAFRLQIIKARGLMALRGYSAAETGEAFLHARELCRQLGDPPEVFTLFRGLFGFHLTSGCYSAALDVARDCRSLAENQNDEAALAYAHRMLGITSLQLGKLSTAHRLLEQAVTFSRAQPHGAPTWYFGLPPPTGEMIFLSPTLCLLGYPEEAVSVGQDAMNRLQQLGYAHSLAEGLSSFTLIRILRREYGLCRNLAEQHLTLAREFGLKNGIAVATMYYRTALVASGETDTTSLRESIDVLQTRGYRIHIAFRFSILAEALMAQSRWETALEVIAEALDLIEETDERWSEAELWRLKGECLLQQNSPNAISKIQACFERAITIARHQKAKWWELRTVASLARLWQQQGKRREAHDILAPVYNWFTEGFDTADLKEAKALLDKLT